MQAAAPERPALAVKAFSRSREREHESRRRAEPALQHIREPAALLRIAQVGRERILLDRQRRLLLDEAPGIFVGDLDESSNPQPLPDRLAERRGLAQEIRIRRRARTARLLSPELSGDTIRWCPLFATEWCPPIGPDRLSIAPAYQLERPARQALPRILLALPQQHRAAGAEPRAQLARERQPLLPLGRSQRLRIPLRPFRVQPRVEGGLAATGELDARGAKLLVGGDPGRAQGLPGLVGEGRRRAYLVAEAADAHLEL